MGEVQLYLIKLKTAIVFPLINRVIMGIIRAILKKMKVSDG